MLLDFEKWHGALNDFIMVWVSDDDVFKALQKETRKLCSKSGSGIGADGIIVLHVGSRKDLLPRKLSVINSDGSLANTCGNGIRCAALSVVKRFVDAGQKKEVPETICFELADGNNVICRLMNSSQLFHSGYVSVSMGVPKLNEKVDFYPALRDMVHQELGTRQDFGLCNISNNHLVLFFEKIDREMLHKIGPIFQHSPHWDGINVHLVAPKTPTQEDNRQARQLGCPLEELYQVFVWERGVGETPACGSGASAIGSLVFDKNIMSRQNWVGIDMPGGRLYIHQGSSGDSVTLAGPAQLVFTGRLEL